MKKLIYISAIVLGIMACDEAEFETFDAKAKIQFHNFLVGTAGENEATPDPVDSLTYTFVFESTDVESVEIGLAVKIIGTASDSDRQFRIEVDPDITTGVSGTDYAPLPEFGIVRANQLIDTVYVTLLRNESLVTNQKSLGVRLVSADDFELGTYDKLNFKINFSDKVEKPAWWDAMGLSYGTYSDVKYRMLVIVSGLTDHSHLNFFSADAKAYTLLVNQYFEDHPEEFEFDEFGNVLDENGLPITWGFYGG